MMLMLCYRLKLTCSHGGALNSTREKEEEAKCVANLINETCDITYIIEFAAK